MDQLVEVRLGDPMELDVLAGRDPERPVADRVGELVHHEVLLGAQHPARDAGADHVERVGRKARGASCATGVPVVLGVGAMELERECGVR